MSRETLYRWIVAGDLPSLEAIEREAVPSGRQLSAHHLEAELQRPDALGVFCGLLAGHSFRGLRLPPGWPVYLPVGYALARWNRRAGHLLRVTVSPTFQRHGYGRALVRFAASQLRAGNPPARVLWATVGERELTWQLFLRGCGFQWSDTLPPVQSDGDRFYRFGLDLTDPSPVTGTEAVPCRP